MISVRVNKLSVFQDVCIESFNYNCWIGLSYCCSFFISCLLFPAEAEKIYGKDKLKIYRSRFVPLYNAITTRKPAFHTKLVTVLPEEKVFLCGLNLGVEDCRSSNSLFSFLR